jgi:peptide/nickel transport system ATP-binding protein
MAPLLAVKDLYVSFPTDDGLVQAVRGVSFQVDPGEVLAIVGESGSGKSVTALSILRLHPKITRMAGAIEYERTDLLRLSQKQMRVIRGKDIAMIFQDPMTALNPVFTVGDQISEMILTHRPMSKAEAWRRATELLEMVGVPEPARRVRQYPHEFSGGMRQRAMIAMAIANEPKLLIADEPTTALDVTIQAQVMEVMKDVQTATGAAMILITHDLGLVAGSADRIAVMYGGLVIEEGTTDEVFYGSRNPYTLGLMNSIPRLDQKGDRLSPIRGTPPSMLHPPAGCAFRPRCDYATEICAATGAPLVPVTEGGSHVSRCHNQQSLPALESAR